MTAAADWIATLRIEAWQAIHEALSAEAVATIEDDPDIRRLVQGALDIGLSVGFARGVAAAKEAQ